MLELEGNLKQTSYHKDLFKVAWFDSEGLVFSTSKSTDSVDLTVVRQQCQYTKLSGHYHNTAWK